MPTPSTSQTPRVNTFLAGRFYDHVSEFKGPLVDFASELERELNQVNKDKEELATWYANMTKACKKSNQERDALKADLNLYLGCFGHCHVNSGDGTDACKQCGLDLRNPIHQRIKDAEFEKLKEGK